MRSTVRHKCKVCGKIFNGGAIRAYERHEAACATKDNSDIFQDTVETLELTIRSARRCAYDLRHCAGRLPAQHSSMERELAKIYGDRADFFVKLFQSGNSMKDYRHQLHHQIDELEHKVKTLQDILAQHKIDDPTCCF